MKLVQEMCCALHTNWKVQNCVASLQSLEILHNFCNLIEKKLLFNERKRRMTFIFQPRNFKAESWILFHRFVGGSKTSLSSSTPSTCDKLDRWSLERFLKMLWPLKHFSLSLCQDWSTASPANVRLIWKTFPRANALAFFCRSVGDEDKMFCSIDTKTKDSFWCLYYKPFYGGKNYWTIVS